MTPVNVLLARWQFGVTIVYHFLFVPLTIGLGFLVAIMQVLAYRTRDETWDRLTRFFGTLFLINFAMGVVTGIVQEFQFGMNWSNYSVFVGNIFGAPLAFEGLLAFFLESTFIGVWIFGRNLLSPLVHTLSIWLASLGSIVSAFFILTANAWMQHPVGYRIVGHGAGRKAVLTDFWAVLRNSTLWAEFSHTVLAAFVTGAMFILGVSAWQILRGRNAAAFTRAARLGAVVALVCVVLVIITGDLQARLMDTQQPMKMAAAEAVYKTQSGASFSLLTIGNLSGQPIFQIRIPHLLSLIATLSWNGRVTGVTGAQAAEVARYGPGSYAPVLWVTYWGFRIMVGLGFLILIMSAWALWRSRRGRQALRTGALDALGAGGLHRLAVPGQHGRLDLHRDGTPALDRVRPAEDRAGRVAHCLSGRRGLHPRRLRRCSTRCSAVIDVILMYLSARHGLGGDPHPSDGPGAPGEAPAEELIH